MPPEKRAKFQDSCRKSSLSTVLDWTTSPPFGHLAFLALAKGAHFDPVKRGLAFALAGRSACSDASASSLTDTTQGAPPPPPRTLDGHASGPVL